jgi:hypothetical protein
VKATSAPRWSSQKETARPCSSIPLFRRSFRRGVYSLLQSLKDFTLIRNVQEEHDNPWNEECRAIGLETAIYVSRVGGYLDGSRRLQSQLLYRDAQWIPFQLSLDRTMRE